MKTQEAIKLVKETESALLDLVHKIEPHLTYEEQDYRDKTDNIERCLAMVIEQTQEAWIHAGRAYRRLIAIRDKEIQGEMEQLHPQNNDSPKR